MKFSTLAAGTIWFLLSACSQVPQEGSHSLSYQKLLQSSDHWKKFAANISNDIEKKLTKESDVDRLTGKLGMTNGSGYIDPNANYHGSLSGPVCVSDQDRSEFGNSLQGFIKESLFNKGISVSCTKNTPYILEWEVSINKFNSERLDFDKGIIQLVGEIPVYLLIGGYDNYINKPHTEIVVTYYLKNNFADTVMINKSNIFYINDEDVNQYGLVKVDTKNPGTTISRKFYATSK